MLGLHVSLPVCLAHDFCKTSFVTKCDLQSEMQEGSAAEITMQDMKGPVLKDFVAYMYGTLQNIAADQLLSLFLAADAHQVLPA